MKIIFGEKNTFDRKICFVNYLSILVWQHHLSDVSMVFSSTLMALCHFFYQVSICNYINRY